MLRWLALALLLAPLPSLAGGCPTCTTSADCGAGAFCVRHDAPFGCGSQLQSCCPGQGCGIDTNGRPTCENQHTCVVVGEDGGVPGADMTAGGDMKGVMIGFPRSGCGCHAGARDGRELPSL